MFVVPDFMAPAYVSCRGDGVRRASRRWRRGERRSTPPAVGRHADAARIPITASDGRHLRLCAPRQSAASSTQTPASRLDAWTQWPSSASVVPGTALALIRRCSGHVTTLSVCTAQAVAVVLSMRDAATMQVTAAARSGSTRVLYLSCDGSLSGGGGAFVPDCRRSIIPRLRCFCFPPPGLASTDAFLPSSPGLGLAGLSVEADALGRFEPEG